ncbi:MAG: hypothetical protein WCW03_00585 [Candidatus Paceibacterota bacterium]|jgi:hypothetical protein
MIKKLFSDSIFLGSLILSFVFVFFFLSPQSVYAENSQPSDACDLITYVNGHKDEKVSLLSSSIDFYAISKGAGTEQLTFSQPNTWAHWGSSPTTPFSTVYKTPFQCPSDKEGYSSPLYFITPKGVFASDDGSSVSVGTLKYQYPRWIGTVPENLFTSELHSVTYSLFFQNWFSNQYKSEGDCNGNEICLVLREYYSKSKITEETSKKATGSLGPLKNLGVVIEDAMIESIATSGNISVGKSDGTVLLNIPATNCVKLSGDGPRKVLFLRTKDWDSSIENFKEMADDVINRGFKIVQPFSNYFGEFTFYIDLKPGGGSCVEHGGFDININFTYQTDKKDLAYAYLESSQVIYNFAQDGRAIFQRICDQFQNKLCFPGPYDVRAYIVMHEVGHAFAGLLDEYLYANAGDIVDHFFSDLSQYSTKNCAKKPTWDYRNENDNKVYGSVVKTGCSFLRESGSEPRQHPIFYYRPSDDSLMKGHTSSIPKFNVISCGYIVAAIKGESLTKANAQKHWPAVDPSGPGGRGCSAMDTVKDGIPPANNLAPTIRATP